MSDALSIRAAAHEVPERVAIIDGEAAYTYRELAALVERAPNDRVVIGTPSLDAIVQALACLERGEPIIFVHPRWVEAERDANVARARGARGAAAIFFTSGTTGVPKAVLHTRRSIEASCRAVLARLDVGPDARWLCALPIAHVAGFAVVMRALISRATLLLGSERDLTRATIASLVPTMLHRLLDTGLTGTTTILLGGASASASLVDRARTRGFRVITTYGLTETFGGIALDGRLLDGVELRISPEHTIEVRGPPLAAGYAGCPFDQHAWFDTRDVGELDASGKLTVRSRRSELIITGGENVYPAEVEAALEASEEVARACVVGVPDEVWGEIVCAAIVPARPAGLDRARLDAHLGGVLAPFKRPRRFAIVSALPETPQGKLDRRRAQEVFARTFEVDTHSQGRDTRPG